MTIFTLFFSLPWLQMLNLPALLQNKNTRIGPFPWKRSVLQNPDRERTNQSTGICLELGLPYNKKGLLTEPNFLLSMKGHSKMFSRLKHILAKIIILLWWKVSIQNLDVNDFQIPRLRGAVGCF